MYYGTAAHDGSTLNRAGLIIRSSRKLQCKYKYNFSRREATVTSSNEYSMTPGLTCSQNDSSDQLKDGCPACLRDLNEADKHHFIGSDIALSNSPVRCRTLGWNALTVLKSVQFPEFTSTIGTSAPLKTVLRDFQHA